MRSTALRSIVFARPRGTGLLSEAMMKDFSDNEGCKKWIRDAVAGLTCGEEVELHDAC